MRFNLGVALALSAMLDRVEMKSPKEKNSPLLWEQVLNSLVEDSLIINDDNEPNLKFLSPGQYLEVKLENINEMQYVAKMKLGSHEAERTLLFDTGSNLLWLTSDHCTSDRCDNKHSTPYNLDDSRSGKYYQEVKIGPDASQTTYYDAYYKQQQS